MGLQLALERRTLQLRQRLLHLSVQTVDQQAESRQERRTMKKEYDDDDGHRLLLVVA